MMIQDFAIERGQKRLEFGNLCGKTKRILVFVRKLGSFSKKSQGFRFKQNVFLLNIANIAKDNVE